MDFLTDPQVWISFFTLAALEIVLGVDNLIFLALLVARLPPDRRDSARVLGLGFAMLTRIALLFGLKWITTLRVPLLSLAAIEFTGRDLLLLGGGVFLIANSAAEIRGQLSGEKPARAPAAANRFALVILQIGIIDIVFSLDTVFTAIGLARQIGVMVAAIVASVVAMMFVSARVIEFIERHARIKIMALSFLVLVGASLIAESVGYEIPKAYLYFAMGFSLGVEILNLRAARPGAGPRDGH